MGAREPAGGRRYTTLRHCEYPKLAQPLAQTLGSAVSDTLSILAKSHQTSHDRVQLRFSSITNYISWLHMSREKPSLMPNQSLPKVIGQP